MPTLSNSSREFVIPISYGSTEVIETGKWGFQKPHSVFMTAPCQEACPVGNQIPQFLYMAGEGRYDEALQTLLKENPFPGVCGRVCFHPCEAECNRASYDEPVSICAMERYVFDATSDHAAGMEPLSNGEAGEVAVVGSGPAGLSCAYFLRLLGHRVTLFETKNEPGGVMRWGIPEYRLPKPVLRKEIERVLGLGIEIKTGIRIGRDLSPADLNRFDAIFLSPGAGLNLPMDIEGENAEQVWQGKGFLERINSGDPIKLGREVIVVGGGNTAMDVARSVIRLGAKATLAYRRTRAEMPASPEEVREAEEEGTCFEFLIQPIRISRLENGRLSVTFRRMRLGDPDQSKRPKAIPIEGGFVTLEADHLVTAVGEGIDLSGWPQDLIKNGLIDGGYFRSAKQGKIFAGGDAVDQPRTIAHAIASGKRGAISIDLCLKGCDEEGVLSRIRVGNRGSLSMEAYLSGRKDGHWPEVKEVVPYDRINTLYFKPSKRATMEKLDLGLALRGFAEVNLGLPPDEAGFSASRCFSCGTCNYCYNCYFFCPEGVISLDPLHQAKTVDLDHCKGCGTCAKACPRSAVEMKEWL